MPAFAFLAVSLFWCLAPHTQHATQRATLACTRAQGLHTRPKQAVAQRVSLLHMDGAVAAGRALTSTSVPERSDSEDRPLLTF